MRRASLLFRAAAIAAVISLPARLAKPGLDFAVSVGKLGLRLRQLTARRPAPYSDVPAPAAFLGSNPLRGDRFVHL